MSSSDQRFARDACDANAASYVLGALGEAEYESFGVHLQTCAICREEVAALQLVADVLPAVAAQVHAPGELKRRVMAQVNADAGWQRDRAAAGARRRRLWVPGRRASLGLGAAAAAAALAALALAGGGAGSRVRVIRAQVLAGRASASLRLSGAHAELTLRDMPQAPSGRVYEVWVKRAGAPKPTGALFTVTGRGSATVSVPGSVLGVRQIMVTAEPRGGSSVPTGAPVIVASLS
jgi:anti-sigma-K factor RskA